jgi:UDP-perosamine 4-acetyltransferase
MPQLALLLGGGGHARVLLELAQLCEMQVEGFVSRDADAPDPTRWDVPWLGDDDAVLGYAPEDFQLINGVGSTGDPTRRRTLYESFVRKGYRFPSLVHPSSTVAADVHLGAGAQVMAGAVIQPGARVGENSIVNTGASVDHDCQIGRHVHIAPGAVLCGEVVADDEVHIGASATILGGLRIGARSLVAAGAVVIGDVQPGARVGGAPAVPLR